MNCERCSRIRYALRTAHFEARSCPRLRIFGIYAGPHGLWHAIRFHFWFGFIGVAFKWQKHGLSAGAHTSPGA